MVTKRLLRPERLPLPGVDAEGQVDGGSRPDDVIAGQRRFQSGGVDPLPRGLACGHRARRRSRPWESLIRSSRRCECRDG